MCYFSNRQFLLEAFSRFIDEKVFSRPRRFMAGKRERMIGLKGFIWLGLFVAAYTNLGSIDEIFRLWIGGCSDAILVSVPAFRQYRAHFPPQGSFSSLA